MPENPLLTDRSQQQPEFSPVLWREFAYPGDHPWHPLPRAFPVVTMPGPLNWRSLTGHHSLDTVVPASTVRTLNAFGFMRLKEYKNDNHYHSTDSALRLSTS